MEYPYPPEQPAQTTPPPFASWGPSLAFGTWAWGDGGYWGYDPARDAAGAVGAFVAAVDAGVRLFDTAEVYGHGESERILGWMARRAGVPLALATKFAPL
ncbi:MAG TPA: aldo/keto reductase, partial [Tetrasphaera sp.]|uniref:aldo/keto reductase n=1 Tax=Nostocoides sp. TaxID=1917966 RepID=UPI002D0FC31C